MSKKKIIAIGYRKENKDYKERDKDRAAEQHTQEVQQQLENREGETKTQGQGAREGHR